MRKHCGLTRHRSNGHCKVRSLNHRVKCDCSVQRIVTSTNNLTASKHVTIRCQIFCIFRETGTCIDVAEPQRQECYHELYIELLNTRTADTDTNISTTLTLLLVMQTQRHIWSLDKGGCIAKQSQQSFAVDGKIYITIQICKITSQLTLLIWLE